MAKEDKRQDLAVYAGTFDPLTNGHTDIVERAVRIFGRVIVAVAASTTKNTLFSLDERVELAKKSLAGLNEKVGKELVSNETGKCELITVEPFSGLLVEFVKKKGAKVIIRGLRAVSDYEYESQMAVINRELSQEIETVFLMTSKRSSFISSSIVRQVAMVGGDISGMVPAPVGDALKAKFT